MEVESVGIADVSELSVSVATLVSVVLSVRVVVSSSDEAVLG